MDTVYNHQDGPYIQTFMFENTGLIIGFLKQKKTAEEIFNFKRFSNYTIKSVSSNFSDNSCLNLIIGLLNTKPINNGIIVCNNNAPMYII